MPDGSVLVADDNRDIRESVCAILEQAGHTSFEAEDGEKALTVLDEHHVDVMLLDLAMPRLDGIGVLAEIQPPPPVVIVVSAIAYVSLDDVSARAKGKVYRCLKKPVPPLQLLDAVSAALALPA